MNFDQTPEFSKELKKFGRKWRSLPTDLEVLKKALTTLYIGASSVPPEHIRETFFATKKGAVLQIISETCEVVKVRMDCTDLNKDMLRVIFIRSDKSILLVEVYAKNKKAREDSLRIQKYQRLFI